MELFIYSKKLVLLVTEEINTWEFHEKPVLNSIVFQPELKSAGFYSTLKNAIT